MKLQIPLPLKLAVLVVGTTIFYTYIGQLVPQKEVLPPAEVMLRDDMTTEEMVEIGKEIAAGKGMCLTCHTVGDSSTGLRFPDLGGIATTAAARIDGMSALEYLAQSIYDPDAFIVEGFNPGMPAIHKPPIGLTDEEILTVVAYLEGLGGTPSVTMETVLTYPGKE